MAWALDAVVVGVVVAGVSVVEVVDEADEVFDAPVVLDVAAVEAVVVEAVAVEAAAVEAVVVEAVAVEAAAVEAAEADRVEDDECAVCADARPEKRATPASDPAANHPVAFRVRRRTAERDEEDMPSLSAAPLGAS